MRRPPQWTEFARYPITAGTILLAAGVSIAWWTKVDISPVLDTIDIRRGEIWRLLTDVLPHVNPIHLLFNIVWMWTLGTLVEQSYGHLATLAIYIVLALGSSAAEFAFMVGGVGLSGVAYGLFGMVLVMSGRDARFRDAVDQQTIVLFAAWFVICIVTTLTNVMLVGNVAHGVGFLLGLGVGWFATARRASLRAIAAAVTLTVTLALVAAAVFARPYINFSPNAALEEANAGYEALNADQNEAAVRWLRDAKRMRPALAGTWFNLAIAYDRLGKRAEAAAAYDRAYQLEPGNEEYRSAHLLRGAGSSTRPSLWRLLQLAS
jgi:membrane associated rhomboid family serine protease